MANITLGQIAAGIALIAGIVGGCKVLNDRMKEALTKLIGDLLKPITDSINQINLRLDSVETEACKNFLVQCISDCERGQELSETEKERFLEQYDFYIKSGHNTYIKNKVEKLRAEGKL